jgi:6-phosphogluconolactonase
MLRLIGFVTGLALLMVACSGGGGGGDASSPPPSPATYTVGGTVTGLTGTGLILQTNAGDLVAVSKAGAFTFTNQLGSGAAYTVTVKTQPSTPAQNCIVTNGSGTVVTANINTVAVACSTVAGVAYTVGGTVSGLVGSGLTLAICHPHYGARSCPSFSELQIGANGAFTLDWNYPAGYSGGDVVFIAQQPSSPTQNCLISNAAISIQNANDTSVTVTCAEYAYVTNAADNTLTAYLVDATTGALSVVGTPIATGASPHAIHGFQSPASADKRYVFVGNEGSNDVSAFAVNSATGALTAVPGSPFAAGTDPQAMEFSFDVSSLYVVNAGSDNLFAYDVDWNTGALTGPSTTATGKNPTSIIRSYGFIFVANHGGSNDISEYYSPPTALGPPFPAGGNPLSLALGTGAGRPFLYSANPDTTHPSISGFSIDPATGAVSPLSGSPFPLPVSHYIATDQMGAYLYVTSGAGIVGYAIDLNTGALTPLPGFPVTVGVDAYSITTDPTNRFLYVTDDVAAHISGFTLDASTGALTPMAGSPFPAGHHPAFMAVF